MAKKLGDFLKELLTKAGVDLSKDELKKVLEIGEEIPDDVAEMASKALIAVKNAHENPDVAKAAKAGFLNAVDKKILEALEESELEADDDFKNERNTYNKIAMITKLAKAAGEKKSKAAPGDKSEWAEKEKGYQKQLADLKKEVEDQKATFDTTRRNDEISFDLREILGGKAYALPKDMAPKLKTKLAMDTIQAELASKGLSITKNEQGQLTIITKDGTPAYSDTHVALEPNTFIDAVLAQNKLLVISGKEKPGPGDKDFVPNPELKGNLNVATEIAEELKALDA
jgi:hypothetical protein